MTWLSDRLQDFLPLLDPELLDALVQRGRRRELDRGELLLSAGDPWRHLWLVEQGALRLFYIDLAGDESNKNFFLEGQPVWPVTDWLRAQPASFFVAALEPCVIHEFAMEAVDQIVGAQPAWQAFRLQALQQLLTEKMWREQLLLQFDATGRYEELRAARPGWCERIPLRHQASWLGMTDVSLSRVRRRLGLN